MKMVMGKASHGTAASQLEPLITRIFKGSEDGFKTQLKLGITVEGNLLDKIDGLIQENKNLEQKFLTYKEEHSVDTYFKRLELEEFKKATG